MTTVQNEIEKLTLLQAATILRAYLECSDEIQAGIREMLMILNDPGADEDDRESTLLTLADALFSHSRERNLGVVLEEAEQRDVEYSNDARDVVDAMDREEAAFASRLRQIMHEQGMTQEDLAAKVGIGQPAVSNMLNRRCRPQRRTVIRLADALNVAPDALWPEVRAE